MINVQALSIRMILALSLLPACFAQTARLTGTVTDTSGRPLEKISISARNEATGVHREAETSNVGVYDMAALQPGSYVIRISKTGFDTVDRTGIVLTVDTVTRLDVQLKVGQSFQVLTVTGDATMLQPNSPEAATTITTDEYDKLPIVQAGRIRSPAAFVFMAPGAQGNYTVTGAENTAATNQVVINGSQMQMTEFYLEGLAAGQMRTVGSFNESAPPVDAVREFKITTSQLGAEFGHTAAAVGSFSLKSGTNDLHGSLYEYFRNNALDATTWGARDKAATRQNEFGFTVGGPVWLPRLYHGKDRTFFFFSYGGSRRSGVDALQNLLIPTPQLISGDMTGQRTVYDPATTRLDASGTRYIRDPFPGNKIPQDRIDPVARAVLSYMPAPNVASPSANYSAYRGELKLNPDVFTGKLDHVLNDAHRLSVSAVFTNVPRNRVDTALPAPLTSGINQTVNGWTARANHLWIVSPNLLNDLAIGFNRFVNAIAPITDQAPSGMRVQGLDSPVLPTYEIRSGYAIIADNNVQNAVENLYQLRNTTSWISRGHTVRFGGEFRRSQFNDNIPQPANANIVFSDLSTGDPNRTGTGFSLASFLLGYAHTAQITNTQQVATRRSYAGLFVQDDWKLNRKLTINLGLRWEFQTVPTEKEDRSSIIDLSVPNPGAGNRPGAVVYAGSGTGRFGRSAFLDNDYSAFGPRVGVAYQVSPSMVLRGGYGVYYSDYGLGVVASGFQAQANYASPDNGLTPAFILSRGFPQSTSLAPSLSPTLLNGQNGTYLEQSSAALPRVQNWTVSIQKAFGSDWLAQAYYIGNRGTRLMAPQMVNINQVDPQYLSLGSLLTQQATSAAAVAAGIPLPYPGFKGTVAQALRPYPQYNTLTSQAAKAGQSNYHAMQLVLRKRFSGGLNMEANYTWSKNLGYNNPSAYGGGVVDNVLQNADNPRGEYTLLPFDTPHSVVLRWTYELPWGKGKRWLNANAWVDGFLGGWRLSGVHRYQSGFPLYITASNTLPIFNRKYRPDIVAGADPATHIAVGDFQPTVDRLIDRSAFRQPAAYQFGTAAPAYSGLRNFSILNEDLALNKQFKVRERAQVIVYGQMFNALNRHRFTGITTDFNAATFGQPSSVSRPRLVQLGLRVRF